jgi:hypothetical protein
VTEAQTYLGWINRRVKELHTKLNQSKKRGGNGWQTKKQCWHIAQKEWSETRRQSFRAAKGR